MRMPFTEVVKSSVFMFRTTKKETKRFSNILYKSHKGSKSPSMGLDGNFDDSEFIFINMFTHQYTTNFTIPNKIYSGDKLVSDITWD